MGAMHAWLQRLPWLVVGILLAGYLLDRSGLLPACARQPVGTLADIEITEVVDGDTFEDSCGRRYRLLNVDTPETDTPWGPAATDFAKGWLRQGPVDVHICRSQPRDRYGRLLAAVTRADGRHLHRDILVAGHGWAFHIPPCGKDRAAQALALTRAARQARRGLWQDWPAQPVDAATAQQQDLPYAVVYDRVSSIERDGGDWRFILGAGANTLELRVAATAVDRFSPPLTAPVALGAEGKLYASRQPPRIYVNSAAQLLPPPGRIADTHPQP